MAKDYKKITKCRICSNTELINVFSLGKIPLPNQYTQTNKEKQIAYPLAINLCKKCGMVQLTHLVDPVTMFSDYTYVPSTSTTHLAHFEELAKTVIKECKIPKKSMVLDIGSNDGSLLKKFKEEDMNILGIDPAKNIAKAANEAGVPTINEFFNKKIARKIRSGNELMQIITATNVFAHVEDLHSVTEGISSLLNKNGVFVAEFPYLIDMLEKNLFDTIYHEHISYLALTPLVNLFSQHNLELFDVDRIDVDGGALRIFVKRKDSPRKIKSSIHKWLKFEEKYNIKRLKPYKEFKKRVEKTKNELISLVRKLNKTKIVAAYGAPAKGNILLNYYKLTKKDILFIADKNPLKQNKLAPGTKIPVVAPEEIYIQDPDYLLILAWNFVNEITNQQKNFSENGGKFIIPLPKPRVI